jgi:hypothetical protein
MEGVEVSLESSSGRLGSIMVLRPVRDFNRYRLTCTTSKCLLESAFNDTWMLCASRCSMSRLFIMSWSPSIGFVSSAWNLDTRFKTNSRSAHRLEPSVNASEQLSVDSSYGRARPHHLIRVRASSDGHFSSFQLVSIQYARVVYDDLTSSIFNTSNVRSHWSKKYFPTQETPHRMFQLFCSNRN